MTLLKQAPPRLSTLPHRLGFGDNIENRRKQDRIRKSQTPYRAWYDSKRWKDLRLEILNRDLYTCQQTGVLLKGRFPADDSPVVDHIKAHQGSEALFWDPSNLQAVSRLWHDTVKRSEERSRTP